MNGSENLTINRANKQKTICWYIRPWRQAAWHSVKDEEKNEHLWKKVGIFKLAGKIQYREKNWCEQYQDGWWPVNMQDDQDGLNMKRQFSLKTKWYFVPTSCGWWWGVGGGGVKVLLGVPSHRFSDIFLIGIIQKCRKIFFMILDVLVALMPSAADIDSNIMESVRNYFSLHAVKHFPHQKKKFQTKIQSLMRPIFYDIWMSRFWEINKGWFELHVTLHWTGKNQN